MIGVGAQLTPRQLAVLRCPDCAGGLTPELRCRACETDFAVDGGPPDLRPRDAHVVNTSVEVRPVNVTPRVSERLPFGSNDRRPVGQDLPPHIDTRMISHFPAYGDVGLALDLGCGDREYQPIVEAMGFEYLGVDYSNQRADLQVDAHRLPFNDDSFDLVLSLAVFEHLQWPLIAASELARVLKPGAKAIGSVAFSEPFHQDSFYHHTHLGISNTLTSAGLVVDQLAANDRWTVLTAFADNALFPRMPRWMKRLAILPVHMVHRLWWRMGRLVASGWTEERRLTLTAGAWTFVAVRPRDP